MDEIRRLERQIKELEKELQRQNAEAVRRRQNMADANLKKLKEYQAEMQKNLDQHDKEVQEEYDRLLREYQNSVNKDIQEQQLKMDAEYQKLLAGAQEKEREWLEKSRQLESLIAELKKNAQDKEETTAYEADKYMTEAAWAYKGVEKKPHEKFFPKRITVFYNAIREARTLYKHGLNEAAIAVSISARSGLNRLNYDIDDELEEWKRQYFIFKNKVGLIHLQLIDETKIWTEFSTGRNIAEVNESQRSQALDMINYWSKGEYGQLCNRTAAFGREIAKIEKEGIENYLKSEESIDSDGLRSNIQALDEMSDTFKSVSGLYKERYISSCERADWGELIIDFLMDEINLSWIEEESHFRNALPEVLEAYDYKTYMGLQYGDGYDKVDTREWLELVFENSMESRIYIYIVPEEKNSGVENRIVLLIDHNGTENDEYSRQIYSHVCESISIEAGDNVINFATDVNQLTMSMNSALRETGKSIEKKMAKIR